MTTEREKHDLTPQDITRAREVLGLAWGMDRALHCSELARVLRLGGRDPGATIRDYERGKTKISGPASVALEMLLEGGVPPDGFPPSRKMTPASQARVILSHLKEYAPLNPEDVEALIGGEPVDD